MNQEARIKKQKKLKSLSSRPIRLWRRVEGSISPDLFGIRFLDSLRSLGMTTYQQGFSFIELILVVAIISVLGFMASGFYARFYTQNTVATTADQIAQTLRKAQLYSMTGKEGGKWGVHNTGTSFVMFQGASYATRNSVFDETWSLNPNLGISGFNDVIFNRMTGTPSAAATMSISGNGSTRSIVVNSQGGINR